MWALYSFFFFCLSRMVPRANIWRSSVQGMTRCQRSTQRRVGCTVRYCQSKMKVSVLGLLYARRRRDVLPVTRRQAGRAVYQRRRRNDASLMRISACTLGQCALVLDGVV
ncbi:hypothetical protein GGS23DRAFT_571910 [Durotheca rogersii]|uniref:uncharacterized protein n=1 Tax=Durotheca rogersii TaxID=419775 RepID=UPI00221F50A3|nr:uncharacterized protein GGS23DRAFT_571910 [Durotheca rogersii]KAI5862332.1 hypothetical protein GGS23DRAFT_571910 [Durotheca rogersii]